MQQPPPIVMQLLGGLGNQLFQAAAAYAFWRHHGGVGAALEIGFDLSRFRSRGLRGYALDSFAFDPSTFPAKIILPSRGLWRRLQQKLGLAPKHIPAYWRGNCYQQPGFGYDSRFFSLETPIFMQGYFQSPRYFAAYAEEIRALFSPQKIASEAARALALRLAGEGSVSLHLRRGDYQSDAKAAAIHGVLGDEYYIKALEYVVAHVKNPHIFVFSDDASAAQAFVERHQARFNHPMEVMRGASDRDDFYLMSAARHHIIANSSFSWWSSWLDARGDGLHIAPKAWFTPEALPTRPTGDLFPEDWVIL